VSNPRRFFGRTGDFLEEPVFTNFLEVFGRASFLEEPVFTNSRLT
jgi:hypothetical protein